MPMNRTIFVILIIKLVICMKFSILWKLANVIWIQKYKHLRFYVKDFTGS